MQVDISQNQSWHEHNVSGLSRPFEQINLTHAPTGTQSQTALPATTLQEAAGERKIGNNRDRQEYSQKLAASSSQKKALAQTRKPTIDILSKMSKPGKGGPGLYKAHGNKTCEVE